MLEYITNDLVPNAIFWVLLGAVVIGVLVAIAKTWKAWLTLIVFTVLGIICGAAILGDGLLPLDSMSFEDLMGASLGSLIGLILAAFVLLSDALE